MENDQESGGSPAGQPIKSWTQATKAHEESVAQTEHASCGLGPGEQHVAWKESYVSWFRKLFCPNCYEDGRMNLVLDIRDMGGYNMPFYTCKRCRCQFTRKPRYEDIIDKKGRI